MLRVCRLFLIILLSALGFCAYTAAQAQAPVNLRTGEQPRDGEYIAMIRGFYFGSGGVELRRGKVYVDMEIRTEGGQSGRLQGEFPTKDSYFSGAGTAMNQQFLLRGRLDRAKASRMSATVWTADGRGARLVAFLPGDRSETWDDE